MEKMIMISSDQYNDMKRRSNKTNKDVNEKKSEAADVTVTKMNDEYVKQTAIKKNKAEHDMEEFSKRMKPLLSLHLNDIDEIMKHIPPDQKTQADFLIQVLSRLPKVSLSKNHILIDHEPMIKKASDVIKLMIDNGIKGTKSIINAMIYGGGDESDDDQTAFHSVAQTPFKKTPIKTSPIMSTPAKSPSQTPKRKRTRIDATEEMPMMTPKRKTPKSQNAISPITASTPKQPKSILKNKGSSVKKRSAIKKQLTFDDELKKPKRTPAMKERRYKALASPRKTLKKLSRSGLEQKDFDGQWLSFSS